MKKNRNIQALFLVLFLAFFVSCQDEGSGNTPTKDDFFNFSMEKEVIVDINYCFPNGNYVVLFEIFDQDPVVEDDNGSIVKKDIEPIYRAATDGKGKYAGQIKISAELSDVWLYSDYGGTISPVKLSDIDKSIVYDQNKYIAESRSHSRSVTPNKHTYPDGWLTLCDWNENGTPTNLLAEKVLPSASTMYTINKIFLTYNKIPLSERYPEFFGSKISSDVKIIKNTKINFVFVNSAASWNNVVGYFTYPTNNPPKSVADIKKILAFPSVKTINGKVGALAAGDQMSLKYWDGEKFQDEFPKGVSIGWWLEGNAFKQGSINLQSYIPCRYSLPNLNENSVQRTVSLRDSNTDQIVAVAFEDNADYNYNDAVFYLHIEQSGAIDVEIPVLPDLENPPTDDNNFTNYHGIIAFEDLWPNKGDYDMNDVMIDYKCKVYKRVSNNKVFKIEDEFTTYHTAGSITSGFGYQLTNINSSAVTGIKITGVDTPSKYMAGETSEPGHNFTTIILYDDADASIGKTMKVTMMLNDVDPLTVVPPYNPFIIAHSNVRRGQEIHPVMHYPTSLVYKPWFGTNDDGSLPENGIFYVAARTTHQYPFAIIMAGVKANDFPIPAEAVAIDVSFPRFRNWVESKGVNDKDWYKR